MTPSEHARVWGIGLGPGDPELLTLKALRLIQAADVIAYPAPEKGDSFARAIAAPHLSGSQREIAIRMPLGDGSFPKSDIYDAAAKEILDEVGNGRRVAVLCEGDPFFYGSFIYLYSRLVDRCSVVIVPGVSSLTACAASSKMPLALRDQTLTIVPGTLPEGELSRHLATAEAAAIVKVGRHLGKVREILEGLGLIERARYIEHATLGTERVLPLKQVTQTQAPYFSTVLVRARG